MFETLQSIVLPVFLALPGAAACAQGAVGLLAGPVRRDGRIADAGARLRETGLPVRDVGPAFESAVRGLEAAWAVRAYGRIVVVCLFPYEEMAAGPGGWTAMRADGSRTEADVSTAGARVREILSRAARIEAPVEVIVATFDGAAVHAPDAERRRILGVSEIHARLVRDRRSGRAVTDAEWGKIAGVTPGRLARRAAGGLLRPGNWGSLGRLALGGGWLWLLASGKPLTEAFWWDLADPLLLLGERLGLM